MKPLKVNLENCYGISSLNYTFNFDAKHNPNTYAIYSPNGVMKTSFARTFERLSIGEKPVEERFGRTAIFQVMANSVDLSREAIHVLKSDLDVQSDTRAVTNILVNPDKKARYDSLVLQLNSKKTAAINALQRASGVPRAEVESSVLTDWGEATFNAAIDKAVSADTPQDLSEFRYATLFNSRVADVLATKEFIERAQDFSDRYRKLFEAAGTIYRKGIFNPAKAEASHSTLNKQGYFAGGHRVHLDGDEHSIDNEEFKSRINSINAQLDEDEALSTLKANLAKNAATQAFSDLIESLSANEVDFLVEMLNPSNQAQFKRELWAFYVKNNSAVAEYQSAYLESKDELSTIVKEAAKLAPAWLDIVELFNSRFLDMPFTLSISNSAATVLGSEPAQLQFTFQDGDDVQTWSQSELRTLSQGERRALHLLNFIFEVENRKHQEQKTLFVIDDAADSFDYKNKYAILEYLSDLNDTAHFYTIILTHNFDFFRALESRVVSRKQCLMTVRTPNGIKLEPSVGVRNYFTTVLRDEAANDNIALCATVPFTRNLIEYTAPDYRVDSDYRLLTELLHWTPNTASITVEEYLRVFNSVFSRDLVAAKSESLSLPFWNVLLNCAREITEESERDPLSLEAKITLSIAIRITTEKYMTERLRELKGDPGYWCHAGGNQFFQLTKALKEFSDVPQAQLRLIEKVRLLITTNIHLNSFMYEPILDVTLDHLIDLYLALDSIGELH